MQIARASASFIALLYAVCSLLDLLQPQALRCFGELIEDLQMQSLGPDLPVFPQPESLPTHPLFGPVRTGSERQLANSRDLAQVDIAVTLFSARAFGPSLFWPDDMPRTKLEPIAPGDQLPGGLIALYDGRGKNETPVWSPQHRTLVFADALTERNGTLRVWSSRSHQERALPALRKLLDLPFERVIISHGEPVHDRAAYENALALPPWED